jgi:PAS domain S-box-containing protein
MLDSKTNEDMLDYLETIINTVREPLIILDEDLRVVTVNHSFYTFFQAKSANTIGQLIFELDNKQWDIPVLRELLETILPQKTSFHDYEVEYNFANIGRRVMLLNAQQMKQTAGRQPIILVAMEDITWQSDVLIIAKEEKVKRTDELVIANQELAFQNEEKDKRAAELAIAKEEKVQRADELVIANQELAFQNKEKDKRADELVIANQELAFQNEEKDKRAAELVIAKEEKVQRADELAIANIELAFQNKEKDKRAAELAIANKDLAFQNKEKDKRAAELVIANEEKVQLLRKLQLSQKMEALGKLTGGIAHEYNNMLGIMLGYSELLKSAFIDNPKLFRYASQIQKACDRAAKLTNKLLTFSQRNTPNAECINLNTLVQQQHHMLEKTLTISINLIYQLQKDPWQVWLNGSDMEDAILNMCINALHAMNDHGQLTIETQNKFINQSDAASLNITAGDYVLLSFTDTGCGFDKETKEKIFDPFFTTKGQLGSGLGLSIVYGFVQNSGGVIDVYSVEGEGSQFTFYFPRYHGAQTHNDEKSEIENSTLDNAIRNDTILIVDDEPDLLEVTRAILTLHGFTVFCAADATEALSILEHESMDIMISDVIMPRIDGYQLATIVKQKYPDIKIQLVSGFSGHRNVDVANIDLQQNLLRKPVTSHVLLERIHQLLDEKT